MRTLTIPVKGIYFDQIKAGTKPFEYRLRTPYWEARLFGREYDRVVLTLGYPKASDAARRLELPWRGYDVQTITHPHFGTGYLRCLESGAALVSASPFAFKDAALPREIGE